MLALSAVVCAYSQSAVSVVNYAGYTGAFPVAPNSIASAYGDFGNVTTTVAETLTPMPRTLAGLSLRVNGVEAPLYFVSRNQINFVVPALTPNGRQAVEVMAGGSPVARGTVVVWEVGPGLAALTAATDRPGIVQNQDFAVNARDRRARRGEVIQIYATGCGVTEPSLADGTPPTPGQLARTRATVEVQVLYENAPLSFAGAHPLYPGICQINAVLPNRPAVTGQVPVAVTVNGVTSNAVTVWVE